MLMPIGVAHRVILSFILPHYLSPIVAHIPIVLSFASIFIPCVLKIVSRQINSSLFRSALWSPVTLQPRVTLMIMMHDCTM